MVLEVRAVGRKTPDDGKLEIVAESARRVGPLGSPLRARLGDAVGRAAVVALACTCRKGGGDAPHTHHFLESELFRALVADETVVIELNATDEGWEVVVSQPHAI